VSIFEDIFGPGPFSHGDTVTVKSKTQTGVFVDMEQAIRSGSMIVLYDGKLFQVTTQELDISGLKPKTPADSTSTANSRAPQSEEK
jgi:hypothetical protein